MKAIDKRAKGYAKDSVQRQAFKAGWNAALDYMANLPYDKMMEKFQEYLDEKERHERKGNAVLDQEKGIQGRE